MDRRQLTPEQAENLRTIYASFAKLSKLPVADLTKGAQAKTSYQKYTKAQVISWLQSPDRNEKNLRNASKYMYDASTHYKRLINYFAKMPTWAYILTPSKFDPFKTKTDAFYKQYLKTAYYVENMQIKHEFQKIMGTLFVEDVFYGVCWETADDFFIQKLNPDNCIISSVESGVYNFAYNMSTIKEAELINYPSEFESLYREYLKDGIRYKEVPSKIGICIKLNEDRAFPLPVFVGVLPALYDIDDFKSLQKSRVEIDNYKALSMQIPVDKDGIPLIDGDMAADYFNDMLEVLPENIGAILSPMKIESWNFEKSGGMKDSDEVHKSEEQYWSSAGTSSLLFGSSENATSSTLKLSIKADEEIALSVMTQFERWLNRRLRNVTGSIKFRAKILPITVFNQDEMIERYNKAGASGLPVKLMLCAAMGFEPSEALGMAHLENDIMKLAEQFTPLQSAHTQTADSGDAGRKTNESKGEDLSESGEETKDSDSNENR